MNNSIPVICGADETVASVTQRLARIGLKLSSVWRGRFEAVPIQEIREPLSHQQKVEARIKEMGTAYVCHPDYTPNPRHFGDPSLNAPSRREFLQTIAENARRDRERNPAYSRSQGA